MKKSKFVVAGGILLALVAFQGCQNCDEAVATAKKEFETKLTSATDSVNSAWQKEADSLKASYEAKISVLDSTLNAQ